MPWYRVPFDFYERARAELGAKPPTHVRDVLQYLASANCEDGISQPLFAGTLIHFNFGHRGNKTAPRPCAVCGWISERLCDWKLPGGNDCDRPLCSACTTSPAPGKDLCPEHVQLYKAWLAGRTNSCDGAGP